MPKGDHWKCPDCKTHNSSQSGYVAQWCRCCYRPWPGFAPASRDSEVTK